MTSIKKRLYFFVILLLFFINPRVCALNISISDPIIRKKVKPGAVSTDSIQLSNPSSNEIKVRAYLEDFIYVAPFDGNKEFSPAGSTKHSCAEWISFSPQEFILTPFGQKSIDYSIRIPMDAQGGYQAVLFFETSLGDMEQESGYLVKVLGRVGALFIVETEESLKEAKIDFKEDHSVISGTFLNTGQVFIKSQGTYYLMDSDGMVLDRGEMKNLYTLPGDKASFTIEPSKDISSKQCTLICTFDLQEGDVIVKELEIRRDSLNNLEILEVKD